jgi:hypothetical protein
LFRKTDVRGTPSFCKHYLINLRWPVHQKGETIGL